MRFKKIVLFIFISATCYSQKEMNEQQIRNVLLYAKVQGGVQHFYPSKAGKKIDWNRMTIYGTGEVLRCENDKELIEKIITLFKPVCDEITFSVGNPVTVSEKRSDGQKYYTYEHHGMGKSMKKIPFLYNPYFVKDKKIKINDTICFYRDSIISEQSGTIYFAIPTTSPKTNLSKDFERLSKYLDTILIDKTLLNSKKGILYPLTFPQYRIAEYIIPWNEIRFFFPYPNSISHIDWDNKLASTIKKVYETSDAKTLFTEMHHLLNPLNDAHLTIPYSFSAKKGIIVYQMYVAPNTLQVEIYYQNDTALIVNVANKYKNIIPPMSIIDSINGISTSEWAKYQKGFISGSEHFKNRKLNEKLLSQYEDSIFVLNITTKEGKSQRIEVIENSKDTYRHHSEQICYNVDDGIYCLDFSAKTASNKTIKKEIKKLLKNPELKGIVIDLRNAYHWEHQFLAYFTDTILKTTNFSYPVKTTPYHIKYYDKNGQWKIRPHKKHFDVPVCFLSSSSLLSYAETVMEIVKHYKLGIIIGEPTAGCNGDVTNISGPMMFCMTTGGPVFNRDGSDLYNVGIIPDIYVTNNIQDVKNGIDNQMNTAIKVIKEHYEK